MSHLQNEELFQKKKKVHVEKEDMCMFQEEVF